MCDSTEKSDWKLKKVKVNRRTKNQVFENQTGRKSVNHRCNSTTNQANLTFSMMVYKSKNYKIPLRLQQMYPVIPVQT